jgi:hypothetical protein
LEWSVEKHDIPAMAPPLRTQAVSLANSK